MSLDFIRKRALLITPFRIKYPVVRRTRSRTLMTGDWRPWHVGVYSIMIGIFYRQRSIPMPSGVKKCIDLDQGQGNDNPGPLEPVSKALLHGKSVKSPPKPAAIGYGDNWTIGTLISLRVFTHEPEKKMYSADAHTMPKPKIHMDMWTLTAALPD
ncbi:hypothetical protein EDB89DRAFT_205548 [Lactarius sanguifluus]|nr:hypothetical protein EDB89DRAFT_205548 [Lactarius sanguifluus]